MKKLLFIISIVVLISVIYTTTRRSATIPTQFPLPSPVSDPVVAAAGDISCNREKTSEECRQQDTADILVAMNPIAVLTLGDNQYEKGEYQNFLNYFDKSWGRVKSITHPTLGNHDYGTQGASGYFDYFAATAGDREKGYYSFDIGSWHIIALNSNCGEIDECQNGSVQLQWLEQDLASHTNTCTLAYWHHPRFSSGYHGSDETYQDFWQTLYKHGADVVLGGHDHDYERFAPLDPAGKLDTKKGIRQFVVGTGGRSLYAIVRALPNSEVRESQTYGVLKLTLAPTSYDWQFVAVAGQTFTDSGTSSCH